MASLSEIQPKIVDGLRSHNISTAISLIESGVTPDTIAELRQIENNQFNTAISKALLTTADGLHVFQGKATAILMNVNGNIAGFFSNNDDSEIHHVFVKAAIEKAAASALVYREGKNKGGLSKNQDYLIDQDFKKHDGVSIKPVVIDGNEYFIGVSGASVNPEINKQALRSDKLFTFTGEDPEWRAAGYWDRFCANRIRSNMMNKRAGQDMGKNLKIPRHQARSKFFD